MRDQPDKVIGIESRIVLLRGQRVLLDEDLAMLYGVEVRSLNQAVRRNKDRFPVDFMFTLSAEESAALRSQTVILESGRGKHRKYAQHAFTEQGVAMLSSVLRSSRAVLVNIEIMRTFVRLRQILASNVELARKLAEMESRYDARFKIVFEAIRDLMSPSPRPKRSIGFSPWSGAVWEEASKE